MSTAPDGAEIETGLSKLLNLMSCSVVPVSLLPHDFTPPAEWGPVCTNRSGYGGPAVYKTTDGGVTWQEMDQGLPPTLVLGLAFDDPVRQNLYAAADAGATIA